MQANILLVDDRLENLRTLAAVLEPLGHPLVHAMSGEEALKCLLKQDFALILMDVQMHGMNGLETAKLIKSRQKTQHIPIIFLTAISKDDEFVFKGYSVGAVDYLFKPFDPEILKSKVNVFIDLYLKSKQLQIQGEKLRQAEIRERRRALQELKRASDTRYHNLTESIPQLVWSCQEADGHIYCNQRWFNYTGLSYEESHRLGLQGALHPEDVAEWQQRWEAARGNGHGFEWEGRLRHGEKHVFCWHLIHVLPEMDHANRVTGWMVTCTNIDDMASAQEALQSLTHQLRDQNNKIEAEVVQRTRELLMQKRFMERLINTAPAGIAYVDKGMICRVVNPEFIRLTGQKMEDLVDHSMHEFCLTQDDCMENSLNQVLVHGESHSVVEVPVRVGDDGRQSHWDVTFHPVLDDNEELDGVLIFSVDVTDRVENVRLQQDQIVRLQQIDKLKNDFLSVISHELRTPLNYIMGFANILNDEMAGPLNAKQLKFLQNILTGSDRMLHLVNDILDFAKMQAGKFELMPEKTDYSPLIDEVLEALKPLADQKQVSLEKAVIEPAAVLCDSRRTIQLLTNLLDNAIKFTPEGGCVEIRTYEEAGFLITEIEDTGVGIAAEDLAKLFMPFQQLDMSSTREAYGTGLGLSISKGLVESHGGRISAHSGGIGQGSIFRFTLPLAPSLPQNLLVQRVSGK